MLSSVRYPLSEAEFQALCPLYLGVRVTEEETNQASTGEDNALLM